MFSNVTLEILWYKRIFDSYQVRWFTFKIHITNMYGLIIWLIGYLNTSKNINIDGIYFDTNIVDHQFIKFNPLSNFPTIQNKILQYSSATRSNWHVEYTHVAREFLVSQLASMPWLLASIILKYIDIISRVLA